MQLNNNRIRNSLFILALLALCTVPLFSAQNHISVPLDHRVYPVLKSAEIRGIIDTGMQVRPYTTSAVLEYLKIIETDSSVSKSEKELAQELTDELYQETQPDNSFNSMLNSGSYTTYSEKLDTSAAFGARMNFQYAQSLTDASVFDSRNGGDFYLRGDIADVASFHMNIGLRFDHLDHKIFLKNDYSIPSEGKYSAFWDFADAHLLYYGLYATPELSVSLLHNKLRLRWASIQRDWGVGTNNFMLSGSARSFNGIELSYDISHWLRYSFVTGTLGKFALGTNRLTNFGDFKKEYHFSDGYRETLYDNNFSAHRVEVDLPLNTTFGIYESVIYRKRFEFGYLNPLSVLMFEQNTMGDFDNMLAGVDLEWTLPGILRTYGSLATTEMNEINPQRFFTAPRNIMGIQAGVDVNLPFLSFSSATLQYTYLSPFFYTHYPHIERYVASYDVSGNPVYERRINEVLSYVNKGENLGYPLRPNSDEVLLSINVNAPKGWDGNFTLKYQRRSGQYGFNIDKFMVYTAASNNEYADKDFVANIFERTFGLQTTVNKTFASVPIKVSASYIMTATSSAGTPQATRVWVLNDDAENYTGAGKVKNVGENEDEDEVSSDDIDYINIIPIEFAEPGSFGPWEFTHALQVGVQIWY